MKNDTIEKITEFLFISKPIEDLTNYDLVIVLGNNFYKENVDILEELLNSKKINKDTKVILSGNKGKLNETLKETEAEIMWELIQKRGLELNCVLEKKATNIKENLVFSKRIAGDLNSYKSILIVGKSFASRRILMCVDALGYPLEKIHIYGFQVDIRKEDWANSPKAKRRILGELERIGKYSLNKDLKL